MMDPQFGVRLLPWRGLPRLVSQGARLSAMAGVAYVLLFAESGVADSGVADSTVADSAIAVPTLAELLSRLSAVEAAYSNVDMEGIEAHTSDVRAASPTPHDRKSVRWVQAGERVKCELKQDRMRGVMVLHPVTSFNAFQHEEDSEPEVSLLSRGAGDQWENQKTNIDIKLWYCRAAYWGDSGSVRETFSDPGMKDVRVAPDPKVPGDVLLSGTTIGVTDGEPFALRVEVVLGGDIGFAVRRFAFVVSDLKGTPRVRKTRAVEYVQQEGKPVVHHIVEDVERLSRKTVERYEYTVSHVSFNPPAESEFTLDGCGIVGVDVAPAPVRRLLVAGSLLVVIAVIVAIFWSHRRGKGESPPPASA